MRPVRAKLEELVNELGPDHVFSTTRLAVRADRYGVVLVLLVALFVLLSTAADDWGRLPAAALSLGVVFTGLEIRKILQRQSRMESQVKAAAAPVVDDSVGHIDYFNLPADQIQTIPATRVFPRISLHQPHPPPGFCSRP